MPRSIWNGGLTVAMGVVFFWGVAGAQPRLETLQGRVIRVIDGDTIEIRRGEGGAEQNRKIRFFAIDAPESSMPWGKACREQLASLVAGKTVEVKVRDLDRYGRTVGQVWVEARDANLAMIQVGCAWHYKQFSRRQSPEERARYSGAEKAARAAKLRLWSEPKPEEPWVYRKKHRR